MSVYVKIVIPHGDGSDDYVEDISITNRGLDGAPGLRDDYRYQVRSFVQGEPERQLWLIHRRGAGVRALVEAALHGLGHE